MKGRALFPKTIKFQTYLLSVVFIGILVFSLTNFVLTQSTRDFTISPGIYPGAPCYTVWREGDSYYAKNAFGAIEYSGTNASYIIQKALDNGRYIYIASGTYLLSRPLQYRDDITIEGAGYDYTADPTHGTILKTDTNFVGDALIKPHDISVRHSGLVLKSMALWVTTARIGIDMASAHESLIQDISIDMNDVSNSIGIYLRNGTGQTTLYNQIVRIYIRRATVGIKIEGGIGGPGVNKNEIKGGNIMDPHPTETTYGIYIDEGRATSNVIRDVDIEGYFDCGIYIGYGGNRVESCYIELTKPNSNGTIVNHHNNYLLFNNIGAQAHTIVVKSGAYRNLIIVTYDKGYILDEGSFTYKIITLNGVVSLPIRRHPTTTDWGDDEKGWVWFCTTHNRLEYWNGTAIVTP